MTISLSKTKVYGKKEILVALDFPGVKLGKGRLSREANSKLDELVREGYLIEGLSQSTPAKPTVATDKPAAPVVERRPTVSAKTVADIGEPTWPEEEWEAFYLDGNDKIVTVGMREVCNVCRGSLSYHVCRKPELFVMNKPVLIYFRHKR